MTIAVTPQELRDMKPLKVSNDLIGDGPALMVRIERDGYAFLQNVLDQGAVARLRQVYVDALIDMGVVDPGSTQPVWNGVDLSNFPKKVEPLHDAKVWERFVAEPTVDAFFTRLLGARPFWIPIVEYRVTPPTSEPWEDPFIQRHQDGFYNQGITFTTCWIPLMEIDDVTGGLAMAEGMNHAGLLHNVDDPPQYEIPREAIPLDVWRRSLYRPGDLVMFNTRIPHTGLPNHSDRFRLSMDVRVASSEGELPVLGEILAVRPDALVVKNHDGRELTLRLDDETYCRWTTGRRLPLAEMLTLLKPGEDILASAKEGHAVMLRPPR
jgi:hypothetical protein